MRITTNREEYFYDFFQEIHPFIPNDEIKLASPDDEFHKFELVHYIDIEKDMVTNYVTISEFSNENGTKKKLHQSTLCRQDKLEIKDEKYIKRLAKLAIYKAMAEYLQVEMPWGALTGVRPTKMAIEYYEQQQDLELVKENLVNDYFLKPSKAELLTKILQCQLPIEKDENVVDFYVHIPFCTTRCSYCTFLSSEISKAQKFVQPYVDALIYELKCTKEMLKRKNLKVKNVYVGGGTPTSLSANQLNLILNELHFDDAKEFTVEAGRPDTIDKAKLDVLFENGVNRISINPQTFNDVALKAIGRAHTSNDIIVAYELARKYPFLINMDLIAGLPNDDNLFVYSLDKAIALNPDNITVHTLSFKTKSPMTKLSDYQNTNNQNLIAQNVEMAEQKLMSAGYMPYYLYRQKNMVGNLENVGYCKDNKKCQFNINSMEDFASVVACGANAVSKRIFFDENRIEREGNAKDLITYIGRIDDMLEKKFKLFD